MFHAGQHDLIALKAGAAERINEMAVQLIRFEVSFVDAVDGSSTGT